MDPNIFRFGICECVGEYRGKFEGKQLTINLGWFLKKHPVILPLHEIPVDESFHARSLRLSRCHSFLDVHPTNGGNGYDVLLDLIELKKDSIGRERVLYGGRKNILSAYWHHEVLPSPESILSTLRGLVNTFSPYEFYLWQNRMSPRNWKLLGK